MGGSLQWRYLRHLVLVTGANSIKEIYNWNSQNRPKYPGACDTPFDTYVGTEIFLSTSFYTSNNMISFMHHNTTHDLMHYYNIVSKTIINHTPLHTCSNHTSSPILLGAPDTYRDMEYSVRWNDDGNTVQWSVKKDA